MRILLVLFSVFSCWRCAALFADDPLQAPSKNFPPPYSKYQIADGSISPNGKYAVILRDVTNGDDPSKNFLVSLAPFRILFELPTDGERIEHDRQGGLDVNWAIDNSALLCVLEGKFGPEGIYVVNLVADKVVKTTDLLSVLRKLVLPDFKKSGADPFNDNFDFFIDEDIDWTFNEWNQIYIDCEFTNDPRLSAKVHWVGRLTGTWDTRSQKLINPLFTRSSP